MYNEQFLHNLGLPEIFNKISLFKDRLIDDIQNAQLKEDINPNENNSLINLPIVCCLNCAYNVDLDPGDMCDPSEKFIKDLEANITCTAFRKYQ
jgi:hypothetical protein